MNHRVASLLAAIVCALAGALAFGATSQPWARALMPLAVIGLLASAVYGAAGGPGVLRVGGAMFRKTLLTYLSYRAQLVAIFAWTTLTVVVLFFAGGHVLRVLFPAIVSLEAEGNVPRHLVTGLLLGLTTWPIFWKAWEVTTLGVRTEQWEGTFESLIPMPNGVRSLPFGYLFARLPYTIFFNLVVLTALAFALPAYALQIDTWRGALDFAAVLATAVACMWGLGLLFGGLAILYKRMGPVDLVVRTLFLFLAGVYLPLAILPGWAQTVARFLPVTYAYELLRGVAIDGIPLVELSTPLVALMAFALVGIVAGNLLYHYYAQKARRDGAIQGY